MTARPSVSAPHDGTETRVQPRAPLTTLFVTRNAPYPARSGSPLRMWQNVNVFAALGPVHVFSVGDRESDAVSMPLVKEWIHVDKTSYPERPYSGLARLAKLIRPRQYPLHNDYITAELNRRLRDVIARARPDIIMLSHWTDDFPDALRSFPNVIVDAHNIESRLARDIWLANAGARETLAVKLQYRRFQQREFSAFRRARSVWVTSEDDARIVKAIDRRLADPVVWPSTIDVDSYRTIRERTIPLPAGFVRTGKTIVFVGFYAYPPNGRAADALISDIMPRVWEREPEARLLFVGKDPTPSMRAAAAREPRIVVTGSVDEIRPYLALADVSAIPLTEGGGTRLKALESFASLIPVVSTRKGIEGIDVVDRRHVILAEEPTAFAAALIESLRDSEERQARLRNAFALVTERYSWASSLRRLETLLLTAAR